MLLLDRFPHVFPFHHGSQFLSDGSKEGTFLWLFVTWLGLLKLWPGNISRGFVFDFSGTKIHSHKFWSTGCEEKKKGGEGGDSPCVVPAQLTFSVEIYCCMIFITNLEEFIFYN